MKFILFWLVTFLAPNGQMQTVELKFHQQFNSERECTTFAVNHEERMPDYFRGVIRAPFEVPVHVQRACRADGTPA